MIDASPSSAPRTVELPDALKALQARWVALPRSEQDKLYAAEFAEPFAKLFAGLPLHGAPGAMERPEALVSVLGFSWQPVALMAAWAKPTRMLVLGTDGPDGSLAVKVGGEGVLSLIARIAGISRDVIDVVRVGDPGETDIYRSVRDFLRRTGLPGRHVLVDPTGGKKSMSASTALAAFLEGAPLVYVDYAQYHAEKRLPVAGTEYPRLLANPLEVLGDLELRHVLAAFDRGDFAEAERLASRLAARLYEPRQAECLARIAKGYGGWDQFRFREAYDALLEASALIERFAPQGGWSWSREACNALTDNLRALATLKNIPENPATVEQGVPLLAWYLAAAQRLLAAGRPSLAVLLTYAAVERYMDLCLWVDFGLDDERPAYEKVSKRLDLEAYDNAGKRFFGANYRRRELEGPLTLANGAQLLAALKPERLALDDFGVLKGLSTSRNKCEFEHGLLPKTPSPEEAARYLDKAHSIIARIAGGDDDLRREVSLCRFPRFLVS